MILRTRHKVLSILGLIGVGLCVLGVVASSNREINFLPRDHRAEWIVFPTSVDAKAHRFASIDATFERDFTLDASPNVGRLMVRGMRRAEVKINGLPVDLPITRDWKKVRETDVVSLLHAGTNHVEARVFNHTGPPAFWLCLTTNELAVPTDESWSASIAGSSSRPAVLASTPKTPGPGNSIAGGEQTLAALLATWPFGVGFVALGLSVMILRRARPEFFAATWFPTGLLIGVALLWLALFYNNTRLLPFHAGFDSKEHLNYIKYIQERRALPLPTEGWEMYQPPLYYLIAAGTLSACNLTTTDSASVVVLRMLGALFAIGQLVALFLGLRLLFGRTAMVGLILAAFLPMHLYLAQYVTNEILAATLATISIYLCLRAMRSDEPNLSQYVWLGLSVGAAMLTKATGILIFPIILTAIAVHLARSRTGLGRSCQIIGVLVLSCLAVCGWHYGRIWIKFGTPLLGNWDVTSGFAWWQEPGYHTACDYGRFGRALTNPLFSGFAGFSDGIYSTLWGDGLCGGLAGLTYAWNGRLMATGYLWALMPTLLILIGAIVAVVRFARRPSSELFLLLGLFAVIAFALIFMTLKVASYAQAKAFYGLSVLTPVCFFATLGWETITRRSRLLQAVIGTLLLAWAMNSFASYWIVPSVSQHLYAVQAFRAEGNLEKATSESAKAIEADPTNASARRFHALNLIDNGRDDEAIREAERCIELGPNNSNAHLQLAMASKSQQRQRGLAEAERAIALGPENSSAYEFLMGCFLESHQTEKAIEIGRDWLAVSPFGAEVHLGLSLALAENGNLAAAAKHLGYVMIFRPELSEAHAKLRRLLLSMAGTPNGMPELRKVASEAPDSPRMLDELAWLLATHPDSNVRDGPQAIQLASRACLLTDRRIPALLDTLAAANAEAGRFSDAVQTAEEALALAHAIGDADGAALSERILNSLRGNLPYREEPVEE